MLLFVDCCIRGELSATRRYAMAYLEKRGEEFQTLCLARQALKPLLAEDIARRDRLLSQGKTADAMFCLARQFKQADEVIIAAPYWDLSFPSLLKVYFENVCVCGITFGYEGEKCVGYARAKTVRYFSTCGGFTNGMHHGVQYSRAICQMLGINELIAYTIEGMDIDPAKREQLLAEAIQRL